MDDYFVTGEFTITLDIEMDVEANSEEEAVEKARQEIIDYYHLNVKGACHSSVEIDASELSADEYP